MNILCVKKIACENCRATLKIDVILAVVEKKNCA